MSKMSAKSNGSTLNRKGSHATLKPTKTELLKRAGITQSGEIGGQSPTKRNFSRVFNTNAMATLVKNDNLKKSLVQSADT
jgi:hypothetical protein